MAVELKVIDGEAPQRRPLAERGGIMVQSVAEAMEIVSALADCNLMPRDIQSKGDAFMIIMAGAELGLGPMASIRSLHIINGRASMSAELILARLLAQGVRHQWVSSTSESATLRLIRQGFEPHDEEFTVADARRAGLLPGKPGCNWQKYPKAMLRARCISAAARAYAPDLMAGGGVYVPEELESIQVEQVSHVKRDVRDDDPEAYDKGVAVAADQKREADQWFEARESELDDMAKAGKVLLAMSDDDREEHTPHLRERLDEWIETHSADYLSHNHAAGQSAIKKAKGRLQYPAKACGVFGNMRAMMRAAADRIEADGSESE